MLLSSGVTTRFLFSIMWHFQCSHELTCPKLTVEPSTPCNFHQRYIALPRPGVRPKSGLDHLKSTCWARTHIRSSCSFSAQWATSREVQLLDSEAERTDRVRSRGFGVGPADRTSDTQNQTRPLSDVLPWRTAASRGGDGTETQQVRAPPSVKVRILKALGCLVFRK